jgi:hypothetical protein
MPPPDPGKPSAMPESPAVATELPTLHSLDELVELAGGRDDLFVRWSAGPDADQDTTSCDELTGVELPGLSANPLAVEEWWGDRSLRLWVARRLYDYRHLRELRGPQVRPWILEGEEVGRGPDNEPLVTFRRAVAWLHPDVVVESTRLVDEQSGPWGPLRRH